MNRKQSERLQAIFNEAADTHLLGDSEFFDRLAKVTDVAQRTAMVRERVDRIKDQLRREAREAFGH